MIKTVGTTDQSILVFIPDSSSTTGAGLTGLTFESSGLVCYYERAGAASVALSLVTQTVTGAHTDGGFVEIDSTNMKGWYRLDTPDAVQATGVDFVGLSLSGATNMGPCNVGIQLIAANLDDATGLGLTALDSLTAPGTEGGLVRGSDTDSLEDVAAAVTDDIEALTTEDGETWAELATYIGAFILNDITSTGVRDRGDTKDRITASRTSTTRTVTARDAT
jgi:hypothetical protein